MKKQKRKKGRLDKLNDMSNSFTEWMRGEYSLLDEMNNKPKPKRRRKKKK